MIDKRKNRGQFVIIAVLLAAIMIVSIGAIMHSTVTYYKHEPWEEYSTLIGDVELNSRRLLELSLATYTHTSDPNILANNLKLWQKDLMNIYYAEGLSLNATLAEGSSYVNGVPLTFSQGLTKNGWNTTIATSAAKADFTLNISSIGLNGYKFAVTAFLRVIVVASSIGKITVAVQGEDNLPITDLVKTNFMVNNDPLAVRNVTKRTYPNYYLVYDIGYVGSDLAFVQVWDDRGICAVAKKTY